MGLVQTQEAKKFLGMDGFFDDAWNDLKTSASDTITKITETGKKAIGLDTAKGEGGTDTFVQPAQTTEAPKKSNTMLYVGLGAGALLVGWLLIRKPKKKK